MKKARYIVMVVAGVLAVAGALVCYRFNLAAFGGGLMGFGMVMLVMGISRLTSGKAAKEAEIEATDERNKAILHASFYYAAQVVMVALAIVGIVYGQFGDYQVMAIALGILFLEFIAMLIARAILSRKM